MRRKPRPAKIPFKDVPIECWAPTLPEQPFIAMYKGLPMIFRAKTQDGAIAAAVNWREDEMERERNRNRTAEEKAQRMKDYHAKKKLEEV